MDYYIKEFNKLEEEFHETLHHYPVFEETIEEINEKDIKEINDLLDKNDEYYLKEAIDKLKNLIAYLKDMNYKVNKEYQLFDKYARIWEKIKTLSVDEAELKKVNDDIRKANELIKSHNLKEIMEANSIMENLIKKYS